MQYCPIENPHPRDGRIKNISERGVSLLVREGHCSGEQITLSGLLPGGRLLFTASGTVRWSNPHSNGSRWHSLGLEWGSLDETNRNRLEAFLRPSVSVKSSIPFYRRYGFQKLNRLKLSVYLGVIAGLSIGFLFGLWGLSLQRQNDQLNMAIVQRENTITKLNQEGQRLRKDLGDAKTQLSQTASEALWLNQQAQLFAVDIRKLSEKVDQIQASYAQVHEERRQLMQKVLELEQERVRLSRTISSYPELNLAISEAISLRLHAKYARSPGNRGYIVYGGHPTKETSRFVIRIHEPESLISASSAASYGDMPKE